MIILLEKGIMQIKKLITTFYKHFELIVYWLNFFTILNS